MFNNIYRQIVPATLLFGSFASHANAQIFVYNQSDGTGAMTTVTPPNGPVTDNVQAYSPGWTIVTPYPGPGLLFYNGQSGLAAETQIDQFGNVSTTNVFNVGSGWSQIVSTKGVLLFYNAASGLAVTGQTLTSTSFNQFPTVLHLPPGWTHIVATDQGSLLFYNAADGSGAVGYLNLVPPGPDPNCPPSCSFNIPVDAQFVLENSYPPGNFTTGWTHVLEAHNGILFYRSGDGLNAMVDVDPNTGAVSTRVNSVQNLTPGWTSIVAQPDSILFYNSTTGDIAIGHVLTGWLVSFQLRGKVAIDQLFPGYFSPGWTNATYAPWGPVIN